MKIAPLFAIAALLGLSACEVPSVEQRKVLDFMVGKNEVDVLRQFGVPSRSFQAEGHTFLAYIQNSTQYTGGGGWGWGGWGGGWGGPGMGWGGWGGGWGGPGMGYGGWGYGGGFPGTAYNLSCQTTFELVTGRVVGWTMRGDGC